MHVNVYYISALAGVALFVWEFAKYWASRQSKNIKSIVVEAIHEAVEPIKTDVAVLKSQVGFLWADAITVLHHPEPSRFRVDYLLDALKAGTIRKAEILELKAALVAIISHEEGSNPAPFKVFQGEQIAAAILLHAIDHVTEGRDG